ncbi:hypothetical protein AB0K02_27965 [Streptomyces sp. NPDC049597]|uniref:hypothetical protein n=1 Tax=Streptomyces sp. NPDC049597 TaxID=3155276 RepID=UPI00343CAD11
MIRVRRTAGASLPMTPQAQVLAGRDVSDVPMLLLAGVIAPVVIIGSDADLVGSGLAVGGWVALRAALGDVGVPEGRMADLERQADVLPNLTSNLITGAMRLSDPKRLATVAVVGTAVAGALYWRQRKRPRVPSQRQPVLPVVRSTSRRGWPHSPSGTPAVRTGGGRRSWGRPATRCCTGSPGHWSGPGSL